MKHAGGAALDAIEPFLKDLRKRVGLKEKTRGNFYRGGRACLHFHEHGTDQMFADIRLSGDDFVRVEVSTGAQRKDLLKKIDAALGDGKSTTKR